MHPVLKHSKVDRRRGRWTSKRDHPPRWPRSSDNKTNGEFECWGRYGQEGRNKRKRRRKERAGKEKKKKRSRKMKRWGEVFAWLTEYKYESQVEKSSVEDLTVCLTVRTYTIPSGTSKPFSPIDIYLEDFAHRPIVSSYFYKFTRISLER